MSIRIVSFVDVLDGENCKPLWVVMENVVSWLFFVPNARSTGTEKLHHGNVLRCQAGVSNRMTMHPSVG